MSHLENLLHFAKEHGSGRIVPSTLEQYPNLVTHAHSLYRNNMLIALSLFTVDRSREWARNSLIVVHKDYRRRGYGKFLFAKKVDLAKRLGLDLVTYIAEDNFASIALVRKYNARILSQSRQTRESGRYTRLRFIIEA